jgi:hypothetical protein
MDQVIFKLIANIQKCEVAEVRSYFGRCAANFKLQLPKRLAIITALIGNPYSRADYTLTSLMELESIIAHRT